MARIDLVDLAHSYSGNDAPPESFALKPVTMTWRQGGAYALLGPSGCGKTTLLNLISGIVTPSRGKILFDGTDITQSTTQKRNIAQVFQFPVIYDTMTVGQNLAFPLKNRGVPPAEIVARVKQIADLLDKPAHTFVGYFIGSPGMNIIPAQVGGNTARIDGHIIALSHRYKHLPSGAKIEIGVRPEFVDVATPAPGLLSANIERIDDL